MPNAREFKTTQLIEWGIHEIWDSEHFVHHEDRGMDKFECEAFVVFRAPDDEKLWGIEYKYNNGAGWNSFTGISYGEDPTPERESFWAIEVHARQVVKTVYEVPELKLGDYCRGERQPARFIGKDSKGCKMCARLDPEYRHVLIERVWSFMKPHDYVKKDGVDYPTDEQLAAEAEKLNPPRQAVRRED